MPAVVGLGLYYAAVLIGSGASLPFMPVWFRAQGLSGAQMTIIFALPMFARTVAGPGLAIWADSFRLRRTPMIWLAAGAAVSYASLSLLHGFWWWLVAWFLGSTMLGVLSPLTDVIALRRARQDGFAYSAPRGVGSAAYICGNVAMGVILLRAPPVAVLVWAVSAAALAAIGARLWLPADPVHDGTAALERRDLIRGLGGLFRQPVFLLAIASVGLIQASHGFYYSFSTLVWRRQGVPEGWIGLLWGFGVGAEVVFLWFLEPWRRRVPPERLLVIGGLGAQAGGAAQSARKRLGGPDPELIHLRRPLDRPGHHRVGPAVRRLGGERLSGHDPAGGHGRRRRCQAGHAADEALASFRDRGVEQQEGAALV
jgi:PPP family 3-phenylpropionic acid transporter